jgi:hypothetical protein
MITFRGIVIALIVLYRVFMKWLRKLIYAYSLEGPNDESFRFLLNFKYILLNYDYFTIKTVLINQICEITTNKFHIFLS